jgi:hypothetical protein
MTVGGDGNDDLPQVDHNGEATSIVFVVLALSSLREDSFGLVLDFGSGLLHYSSQVAS